MIGLIAILGILLVGVLCWAIQAQTKAKQATKDRDEAIAERERIRHAGAALLQERNTVLQKYQGIIDAEAERDRVLAELTAKKHDLLSQIEADKASALTQLETEVGARKTALNTDLLAVQSQLDQRRNEKSNLETLLAELKKEVEPLEESAELQSVGFYKSKYAFPSSSRYQVEVDKIRSEQRGLLKDRLAARCNITWTVNGSKTEGKKQTDQTIKLMLRAFNGECDAAIAKVTFSNVKLMEARMNKAFDALNKLASIQSCEIMPGYLNLKLQELYLVYEYQEKVQSEREEQQRIREQMREEEIAEREIEKAKEEAEKDERRYAEALRKARAEADAASGHAQEKLQQLVSDLEVRLREAQSNKERALARAQMTRAGHVYVISNIGSFGDDIYKIGMTRRLDPQDRINELGDASVPFRFDVHAVIYSEDAPTLENTLHQKFQDRRVNMVNYRKEYFKVPLKEIEAEVRKNYADIDIIEVAEAKEYRQTLALLQEHLKAQANGVMP